MMAYMTAKDKKKDCRRNEREQHERVGKKKTTGEKRKR